VAAKSDNTVEVKDHRKPPFFIVDRAVVDSLGKIIGPFGHAVYTSLLRHANTERQAWSSLDLIAKEWNIGKSSVIRHIEVLEKLHVITIERVEGKHNIYHVNDIEAWKAFVPLTSVTETPVVPLTSVTETPVVPLTSVTETPVVPLTSVTETPEEDKDYKKKNKYLSALLFEEIIKTNPHSRLVALQPKKKEAAIALWTEDIDKLIRIDKQDPSVVEEIIKKATHDDFWGRNVLSGEALRRHWDKLTKVFLQANTKSTTPQDKPKTGYILSKDGQWFRIENGEQVRVDEANVPDNIRNKLTGRSTQAPPSPVSSLIADIANRLTMDRV
jgi:hypothetical protein